MDGVRAFLRFAVYIWKWSVAKNLADDFPPTTFFVDAPRDSFHSLLGFDEGRMVAMGVAPMMAPRRREYLRRRWAGLMRRDGKSHACQGRR